MTTFMMLAFISVIKLKRSEILGWPKFGRVWVSVGVKMGQDEWLIHLQSWFKINNFMQFPWGKLWYLCDMCDIHIKNRNKHAVSVIAVDWFFILLRRTIVGATFQQQSAFIQFPELGYADEIVVHSRDLPLSGLPSGACRWPRQWQEFRTPNQVECTISECRGEPTGVWFTSTAAERCSLSVCSIQVNRRDHRANSWVKHQNTAALASPTFIPCMTNVLLKS